LFKITGFHNYHPNSLRPFFYVFDNSYYAFRIFLLGLVFYFVKHQLKVNQQLHQLTLEKKQAELQVLKSQLSPHFLFNTLNSFYADALEVDSKLSDDILKLSEMLRYVTYGSEDFVLLKDELNFLDNYIALFKRRFDGQLFIHKSFPKNVNGYQVPSLLFIHFVENAFKHGILNDKENPIQFQIEIRQEHLVFKIENTFRPQAHYAEKGIGYKNISQRLNLMFKKQYNLEHFQKENKYFVKLKFPLKK
jgi:LytS/YehU family sensor histidine kinase